MEMLCPECLGSLAAIDGSSARCTLNPAHQYRILYTKGGAVATGVAGGAPSTTPDGRCRRHPDVTADRACARCGQSVCETCAFPLPGGQVSCPDCALGVTPASLRPAAVAIQGTCRRHPDATAVQVCQTCKTPVCATCDFELPGGVHLCPDCATTPQTKLNPSRRKTLIWSYVCAFVTIALLVSSMVAFSISPTGESAGGELLFGMGLIAPLIGLGLGFGTVDRRLRNPAGVWIAIALNALFLGVYLLLVLLGLLMMA